MPGICGVVSSLGDFRLIEERLRHVHEFQQLAFLECKYTSAECLIVSFSRPARASAIPAAADPASSAAVLFIEGEIYNADELVRGHSTSARPDIADALLDHFRSRGPEFVTFLDGEFNIVIYEPASRRLTILNDHVGSHPMYYWQDGESLHFGSEKKFVLVSCQRKPVIDPVGLLQPFVHQHNLEDRTFIEGLKRLPPSSILKFSNGRLAVASTDAIQGEMSLSHRSSAVLDEWESRLKKATVKRIRDKSRLLISLSAGLDSRAIACALDRHVRPIWARTWGTRESSEVVYASQIAAALGIHHVPEDPFDFNLSDGIRHIVWRTDGETEFRNGLSLFTHRKTKELGDHVLGGWLGDVTSGAHLRPFMLPPMRREVFVDRVFRWYRQRGPTELRHVFNEHFLASYWPEVKSTFADSYARFREFPNVKAHELWDIRNRQTRMTVSSMPVDSHLFGKVRPFFDRAYMEFVMSLPLHWRLGQILYKSLIHRIGPEIRSIPNANTGVRLHASPLFNLAGYGRSQAKRIAAKLMKYARPIVRVSSRSVPTMDVSVHTKLDDGLRRLIESFAASEEFDRDIFDKSAICNLLSRHYDGNEDRSELICYLATCIVALQQFVYGDDQQYSMKGLPRIQ